MRFGVMPLRELPPVTKWTAALFLAGWLAPIAFGPRVSVSLGLVPYLFTREFWLWQGVTYIFIHAGFWHFLFNTFMLWMLGGMLEERMGSRRFLLFFYGCGLAAALVTAGWQPESLRPVVGGSGAVFGLLGAFAFLYPDATVHLYFLFPMSARTLVIILGGVELLMTLTAPGSGISSITHLGGLAAGLAWLWGEKRWKEREVPELPDPAVLEQQEIDRLLEKISRKGEKALSAAEVSRLDEYARRRGGKA